MGKAGRANSVHLSAGAAKFVESPTAGAAKNVESPTAGASKKVESPTAGAAKFVDVTREVPRAEAPKGPVRLVLTSPDPTGAELGEAEKLAGHLGIPLVIAEEPETAGQSKRQPERPTTRHRAWNGENPDDLVLRWTGAALTLERSGQSIACDFSHFARRLRPANLDRELVVRAARIRGVEGPLRVLDGTAGLGEDALLLAGAGYEITLLERDPVIFALLRDGLRRAAQSEDPALAAAASRMTAFEADSILWMRKLAQSPSAADRPDIIFLDPMFPERRKSGLVKKKFQLIHQLEDPEANDQALLEAAFAAAPRKIVIKRPAKGPFLGGLTPGYALRGKTIRYDCLIPPRGKGTI